MGQAKGLTPWLQSKLLECSRDWNCFQIEQGIQIKCILCLFNRHKSMAIIVKTEDMEQHKVRYVMHDQSKFWQQREKLYTNQFLASTCTVASVQAAHILTIYGM